MAILVPLFVFVLLSCFSCLAPGWLGCTVSSIDNHGNAAVSSFLLLSACRAFFLDGVLCTFCQVSTAMAMNTCVAAQQPRRALDLFRDMRDVGRVSKKSGFPSYIAFKGKEAGGGGTTPMITASCMSRSWKVEVCQKKTSHQKR